MNSNLLPYPGEYRVWKRNSIKQNSNLPPYPGEYGVKDEHDVPAATKMGASFTHVVITHWKERKL